MNLVEAPERDPDMCIAVDVDLSSWDLWLWFPEMILVEDSVAYRMVFEYGKLHYEDDNYCIVELPKCAQDEYELRLLRQILDEA